MRKPLAFVGALLLVSASVDSVAQSYPQEQSPRLTYEQFGNTTYGYGSSGQTSQRSGNTMSAQSGQVYQQFGSSTYGPGGQTYQQFGNRIYGPNGEHWQQYGNRIYGPNGRVCQAYGDRTYCQ